MDEATLLKAIIQSGPLVAFMFWIIWNQRQANDALQKCVQVVQDERFEAMENHIEKLEARSEKLERNSAECQADRLRMQQEITDLKLRAS